MTEERYNKLSSLLRHPHHKPEEGNPPVDERGRDKRLLESPDEDDEV